VQNKSGYFIDVKSFVKFFLDLPHIWTN